MNIYAVSMLLSAIDSRPYVSHYIINVSSVYCDVNACCSVSYLWGDGFISYLVLYCRATCYDFLYNVEYGIGELGAFFV